MKKYLIAVISLFFIFVLTILLTPHSYASYSSKERMINKKTPEILYVTCYILSPCPTTKFIKGNTYYIAFIYDAFDEIGSDIRQAESCFSFSPNYKEIECEP